MLAMNPARSVWSQQAACNNKPEIYLADRPNRDDYAPICNKICPVKDLCLSHAIVNDERGIWGGMTYLQRQKLPEMFKLMLNLSKVPKESPISEYLKEDHPSPESQQPLASVSQLSSKQLQKKASVLREEAKVVYSGLDSFLHSLPDTSSLTELLAG